MLKLKTLIFFILLLPISSYAQYTISGRVLNQADTKPVAIASVFLSNTTTGAKTDEKGVFTLHHVKSGKYELVISIVGFETFNRTINVVDHNIALPDITVFPKTTALNEVSVKYHNDPDREKYLNWFRDEFLGTDSMARQCTILNPDVLDLSYDQDAAKLTASSYDYLKIENDALGYRVNYLVKDFLLQNAQSYVKDFALQHPDGAEKKVFYQGRVLFEELKGSAGEERRWKKNREEVYGNSPMHFLRAALSNRLNEEGFRIQQFAIYANPDRPTDSVIDARIKFYRNVKSPTASTRDSLSFWIKKSKLTKTFTKLLPFPLGSRDVISGTNERKTYAFGCDNDGVYIAYNKNHRYHTVDPEYLYNTSNTDNTLVKFNSPEAFFDSNGVINNPYSVIYYGVWGRHRVAELLPVNYEPSQSATLPADNLVDDVSDKLETFDTTHVREKAYLHFDKPYYAAGDTVYFKAYITAGEKHELSNLSGVLHVGLINAGNKTDQSIKLQITDGVAWGDFTLPDSLPKGNYRVRAYTRWMQNDGNDNFFEQPIAIGTLQKSKIPESAVFVKQPGEKPDIQFFPESGNLVADIRCRVAFKAATVGGKGIDLKGELIDNENKTVSTFASAHLGMGSFYFTPQPGATYSAKIIYADGNSAVAYLPKADQNGIELSVNNDSIPNAALTITSGGNYFRENRDKQYTLLITSGGSVTSVPCTLDSNVIKLNILKRHLKTGVATVTLFSPDNQPLCERLFFVQNYDQLSIDVAPGKQSYAKREKVNLQFNIKTRADSAAMGHFSVSVTDEAIVPVDDKDEHTILTDLLLTSDLKGYIEQPNYYFINPNPQTNADLDLVMLTHGYRRFEWKKLLNNGYPPIAYQPEKGLEINGMAKNALGKPLVNGTVSLIAQKQGALLSTQTDQKGNFSFTGLNFSDSTKFIVQAVNAKGKNSTSLVYYKEKNVVPVDTMATTINIARPSPIYLQNSLKRHTEAVTYGQANGIMLKQVNIRENKKHIIDQDYPSSSLAGPGFADQVMHRKELEQIGGPLAVSLLGRLRGINFIQPQDTHLGVPFLRDYATGPMLVVIDGTPQPIGFGINEINASTIETIEVLKFASASMYGVDGGNGVLVFTTKQGGGDPNDIHSVGILPITVAGFYKAREFYAPKYDHPDEQLKRADLRSTIYWQPELLTDKDGNASLSFYNADGAGTYRVVIEGIDDKGNLGRQVFRYKVE